MRGRAQAGVAAVLAIAVLVAAATLLLLAQLVPGASRRDAVGDGALAQAREGLLAYAAERAIGVEVGPGFLPCPDLDDDGWAEAICGSLAGDRGQAERLGRLPWKTLGLPDLRDGHGERLWYAVATRYKGLLNCAASAACVELTPATAIGTITVRGTDGRVLHDGALMDHERGGAAAVVIAPGAALERLASAVLPARTQRRDCTPPDCDADGRCATDPPQRAARCDPANYLDAAPAERSGEDNAAFHDRNDGERWRNRDGFIHGAIVDSSARRVVNDRLVAILPREILPRAMRRVALEAAHCLSAAGPALPQPDPACATSPPREPFGRIPDQALAASATCSLSRAEGSWWKAWRPFLLYSAAEGLEVVDGEGLPIARDRRIALVVSGQPDACASSWLECGASRCTRLVAVAPSHHAVAIALP